MLRAMDRHAKDIAVTKLKIVAVNPCCPQLTRVTASVLANTTNNLDRTQTRFTISSSTCTGCTCFG